MKDSIKKGMGLGIGLYLARLSISVVQDLIFMGLANNESYMTGLKDRNTELYEFIMKYHK